MDFDKIINKRKSCRSFKDKKAPIKLILEAIDAATKIPLAGNHYNIHFLIIENPKTIEKLTDFCQQSWINEAPVVIVVASDDTHLENLYDERGRIYSRQQAGAAIHQLILKLTELDLASCWVGAYTDETIKQTLKIPQHYQVEAIIPVGYEKGRQPRSKKKNLEKVIFWESWDKWKRPTSIKDPYV
jgi:nitroreductase